MEVRVEDAHYEISWHGARIANEMMAVDPRIPPQYINVWVPSGQRTLGIVFDEGMLRLSDEVVSAMQEIGRKAMAQALAEKGPLFAGLIIGDAREGRNYFDRF